MNNALALQIRPPEIRQPDLTTPLMAATQLRQADTQNQLANFQLTRGQEELANRRNALAIFQAGGPDAGRRAMGVHPETALQIQAFEAQQRNNLINEQSARVQQAAQAGLAVLNAPPERRAALYQQERARLLKLWPDAQIPEQYDEATVQALVNRAKTLQQHFEQPMVGGRPISMLPGPAPAAQPMSSTFAPGMTGGTIDRIIGVESGGNPLAKNPRSTATGAGQFINSTWLSTIKAARPDLATGRSDAELLALRSDPTISREMTAAYAAQNGQVLAGAGLPVTPGTTYLAHFAGPQGATAILRADPNASAGSILGAKVVQANPFLRGMTAGQLVAWADRKMAGAETSPTRMADASGMVPPTNTAALDPAMLSPGAMGGGSPMGRQPVPQQPPAQQTVAPIPGQPGSMAAAQPVTIKGKPYTEGAPPGLQWGMKPDGTWVQMPVPGSEAADKELVKVNDPNSPTGESYMRRADIKPGMAPAKDATEGQANARLYVSRMENAEKVIQRVETAGTGHLDRMYGSIAQGGTFTPTVVQGFANRMVTKEFQQLRQAERDFVNAVLRRESGAVISDQEFANAAQQYFPQPGDSKEVIAQKRESRRLAIEGIKRASQPGYGATGPTGTPPPSGVAPPAQAAPPAAAGVPPPPPGFVVQ